MQVAMGYFESCDDETNAVALIQCFLSQPNPFCDKH